MKRQTGRTRLPLSFGRTWLGEIGALPRVSLIAGREGSPPEPVQSETGEERAGLDLAVGRAEWPPGPFPGRRLAELFATVSAAAPPAGSAGLEASSTDGRVASDMVRSGPGSFSRLSLRRWFHEVRGGAAGASPGGARSGMPGSGSVGVERRFGCEACGRPSGVAPAPAELVSGVSNGDASVAGAGVLPRAAGFLRPGAAPPPLSGLSISKGERSSGGGFGIAGLPPGAAGPGISSPSPSPKDGLGPSIGFFFSSSAVLGPSGLRKAQPSGNFLHWVGKYP